MEDGAIGPHSHIALWRVEMETKSDHGHVLTQVLLMVDTTVQGIQSKQLAAVQSTVQVINYNELHKHV